jgi:hypothetical protein
VRGLRRERSPPHQRSHPRAVEYGHARLAPGRVDSLTAVLIFIKMVHEATHRPNSGRHSVAPAGALRGQLLGAGGASRSLRTQNDAHAEAWCAAHFGSMDARHQALSLALRLVGSGLLAVGETRPEAAAGGVGMRPVSV